MVRTRRRTSARWIVLFSVMSLVLVGAVPVALGDPPGNNGTVKIDGVEFDDAPNNEPHVGCIFEVDFYGYDEGDLQAAVTFEAQAPTAGGVLLEDIVDIGEDAAGGGTDLDASVEYNLATALAGIEPHPQQGYHVKLTVNAEGSIGADVKHKVFWVTGCEKPDPGKITIEKEVRAATKTVFPFTGTWDFSLTDFSIGTGDAGSQIMFDGLAPGEYTVTELPTAGWELTNLTCTTANGNSSWVIQDATVVIDLASGDEVYCIFQNSPEKKHL